MRNREVRRLKVLVLRLIVPPTDRPLHRQCPDMFSNAVSSDQQKVASCECDRFGLRLFLSAGAAATREARDKLLSFRRVRTATAEQPGRVSSKGSTGC